MVEDILDALEDLGYDPPIVNGEDLGKICASDGVAQEFMEICVWICNQIKDYCSVKETVKMQNDTFRLDISGFLREMDCPFSELIGINALDTKENRLLLLDYLLTELMSCRLTGGFHDQYEEVSGNPILKPIFSVTRDLKIPSPSKDETIFKVFTSIENKVKTLLVKLPPQYHSSALLSQRLNEDQWAQVEKINEILSQEYSVRKEVLLKRIDLTVQSFMWSDQAKSKKKDIIASFNPIRERIAARTNLSISDVLAARKDLCKLEKTSSGEAREVTKCNINKIQIGKVPDRGGRPSSEAPPPEMPAFRKRTEPPKNQRGNQRGGGRNRGGFGDRGGRGWSRGGGGGGGARGGGGAKGGWSGRGSRGEGRGYDHGNRENFGGNEKVYFS